MRNTVFAVVAGAAMISGTAACKTPPSSGASYDYVEVCVNPVTMTRIPDSFCRGNYGDRWSYYPVGATVPRMNAAVQQTTVINNKTVNIFNPPPATNGKTPSVQPGGAPENGGKVTRGGLGVPPKTTTAAVTTTAPAKTTTQAPAPKTTAANSAPTTRQLRGSVPTKTK
jgi:hypothetical protein